MRAHIEE
jgi:hypothetical protein